MFICDTCLKKNYKNDQSFTSSFGQCEWCKETAQCNDIPSGRLIPINPPKKVSPKNVHMQRSVKEYGNPKTGGMHFTNLGSLDFYLSFNHWLKKDEWDGDRIVEPEWWLEPVSESKFLEGVLPHKSIDETFIEHEISYQHHGTARMAINKYKKFILEKLKDTK